MKVVLVNPSQIGLVHKKGRVYNRKWPPTDLANCAALLEREGAQVAIIDANAEDLPPGEVARRASGFDKAFITSTGLDRWQCPHLDLDPFLSTTRALREAVPEVYVMGTHGTVKPNEILEAARAQAVVRGEPERTIVELFNGNPLAEVRGITWHNGRGPVSNPEQKPVNMDELPLPAWHLLPMDRYHYEVLGDRFTLFEMSRGCASHCTFCLLKTYGVGVRKKSLDRMAREVEDAVRNHGVRRAYFIDLEFTVLRKQVAEFCRWLIKQNFDFTWCCQTRLDLVDDELLKLMKRAGCRLIHFGVEAANDEILRDVEKEITVREIEDGLGKVHAAGIESACFFLMGFPESTKKDMDDIVRFAKRLNITYALFHVVAPYPGTQLYERVKADPRLRFSDDSLFPEAVEARFTVEELKAMTRRAYLEYYLRPAYVMARIRKGNFRALFNQLRLFRAFVSA